MTDARSTILASIRSANGSSTELASAAASWEQIPRDYTLRSALSHEAVLDLLIDRLVDYDAAVVRCALDEVPAAIRSALAQHSVRRVVVPPGLPREILPAGFEIVSDRELQPLELDTFQATVTLCTLAIAETGTLVLRGSDAQGRRATTLVPDVHVCILRTQDVVATVPEAFALLEPFAREPLTFVSGPSATADIEMTRIKGVHGPRFLHVLLLNDRAG